MAYVPPQMRNNRQQQPRRPHKKQNWEIDLEVAQEKRQKAAADEVTRKSALEKTVDNYPPLANAQVVSSKWVGNYTFTDLATEWKSASIAQKEEEEMAKIRSRQQEYGFSLPRFRNIQHFEEPEDNLISPLENVKEEEDDGWNTIQRTKARKPKHEKTLQDLEKETAQEAAAQDDTVWNQDQEHETCWD